MGNLDPDSAPAADLNGFVHSFEEHSLFISDVGGIDPSPAGHHPGHGQDLFGGSEPARNVFQARGHSKCALVEPLFQRPKDQAHLFL